MSLDCRYGEVGYILIGKFIDYFNFGCQTAQTGAEHNGSERTHLRVIFNPLGCFLNFG